MRFLKILLIIFIVYLIRRFILMYIEMKRIQKQNEDATIKEKQKNPEGKVVDADFKVMD